MIHTCGRTSIFCLLFFMLTGQVILANSLSAISDEYPIYLTENLTKLTNKKCECEPSAVPDSQWSSWTKCMSDETHQCHHGYRYRIQECSSGERDPCTMQELQYCYHNETCKGEWIDFTDKNSCSHTCGGGVRVNLKLCLKDDRVGLDCVSDQRRYYIYSYTECNAQPCPVESSRSSYSLTPNLSTWVAIAGGVIGIIVAIGITSVCLRKSKRNNRRDDNQKKIAEANKSSSLSTTLSSYRRRSSINSTLPPLRVPIKDEHSVKLRDNTPKRPSTLYDSFSEEDLVSNEATVYALAFNHANASPIVPPRNKSRTGDASANHVYEYADDLFPPGKQGNKNVDTDQPKPIKKDYRIDEQYTIIVPKDASKNHQSTILHNVLHGQHRNQSCS